MSGRKVSVAWKEQNYYAAGHVANYLEAIYVPMIGATVSGVQSHHILALCW